MNRLGLTTPLALLLISLAGCTTGADNPSVLGQQAAGNGYCHKKVQPIGSADPLRPNQTGGGVIDYYGPCDGPTVSEQIQAQKRFEQFRFGRDYMDEG